MERVLKLIDISTIVIKIRIILLFYFFDEAYFSMQTRATAPHSLPFLSPLTPISKYRAYGVWLANAAK